jgi:hypothetical protein
MAQLAGRAITAQIPVVPCFDNNRYFTLRSRVFPSVSLRDGAMLTSIATEQKYMSDSSATLRNTMLMKRLQSSRTVVMTRSCLLEQTLSPLPTTFDQPFSKLYDN